MNQVLPGKEVRVIYIGLAFRCRWPEICGEGWALIEFITVGRDYERVPGVGIMCEQN
jgi:hypothetical protein